VQDDAVPDRYVIVVPVNAPETLAYLTESFKHVPDVQVVADRRNRRAPAVTMPTERRAVRRTQEAFGCALVRIEQGVKPATPPPDAIAPPQPPAAVPVRSSIQFRDLPLLRER
jgi:hypothetical protein